MGVMVPVDGVEALGFGLNDILRHALDFPTLPMKG